MLLFYRRRPFTLSLPIHIFMGIIHCMISQKTFFPFGGFISNLLKIYYILFINLNSSVGHVYSAGRKLG